MRALSPVGRKTLLKASGKGLGLPTGYSAYYVDSGTSALALALLMTKELRQIDTGEVIIPGYACPDLVASCLYAGLTPRVVDIQLADPAYDHSQLADAINDNTVAIVAVNFLGIRQPLEPLTVLVAERPVAIIEDNAQWLPVSNGRFDLNCDLSIISFGRGKPVSLSGGGALIVRDAVGLDHQAIESRINKTACSWSGDVLTRCRMLLMNQLLQPTLYGLIKSLPGLNIGATEYHALASIDQLDASRRCLIAANVNSYISEQHRLQDDYQQQLSGWLDVQFLPALQHSSRTGRLLRYPLLISDFATREAIADSLGYLGVSRFYNDSLDHITGVPHDKVKFGPLDNARSFARQLLTLPLHPQVTTKDADQLLERLRQRLA